MSTYRRYALTLTSQESSATLHLGDFADLRKVLGHLTTTSACGQVATECVYGDSLNIRYERVWFVDGFVSAPPSDFEPGVDLLDSACPRRILEALNG